MKGVQKCTVLTEEDLGTSLRRSSAQKRGPGGGGGLDAINR